MSRFHKHKDTQGCSLPSPLYGCVQIESFSLVWTSWPACIATMLFVEPLLNCTSTLELQIQLGRALLSNGVFCAFLISPGYFFPFPPQELRDKRQRQRHTSLSNSLCAVFLWQCQLSGNCWAQMLQQSCSYKALMILPARKGAKSDWFFQPKFPQDKMLCGCR